MTKKTIKSNVAEMEKDKIRERLSSETNFWYQKKIVTIFDCCWHFTVPVYISCFPVLFKFVSFNYWHIALMQKKAANELTVLETCQRDSQSWNDRKLKSFGNFGSFVFFVIIHCYSQLQEQKFSWSVLKSAMAKTLPSLW